jgi:membrane protease YdiL (CAAX protease family)
MSMAEPTERATPPHLDGKYALDREVAMSLDVDAPWRRAAVIPAVAVLALGIVIPLVVIGLDLPRHGDVRAAYGLVGEVTFAAIVVVVALPVVRRMGGWTQTVGLDPPRTGDAWSVVRWFFAQFGARICVGIVIAIAAPHVHPVGNAAGVDKLQSTGRVLVLISAVAIAPLVEEIAFRGLMLRAMMRRLGYWPAAGLSSLVFALLHAPSVPNLESAIVIVLVIYVFGLLQCQLVRRHARLAPAVGVHAATNLVTLMIALAAA